MGRGSIYKHSKGLDILEASESSYLVFRTPVDDTMIIRTENEVPTLCRQNRWFGKTLPQIVSEMFGFVIY